MSLTTSSHNRIACMLVLDALLAGCNSDNTKNGVRSGPQAVHPSTSTLAQGVVAVPEPQATPELTCGGAGQPACYAPDTNDGSMPIID